MNNSDQPIKGSNEPERSNINTDNIWIKLLSLVILFSIILSIRLFISKDPWVILLVLAGVILLLFLLVYAYLYVTVGPRKR